MMIYDGITRQKNGKISRGSKFRFNDAGSLSLALDGLEISISTPGDQLERSRSQLSQEDRPCSFFFSPIPCLFRPAVFSLFERSSSFLIQSFIIGFRHPPLFAFSSWWPGRRRSIPSSHTHIHIHTYMRACGRHNLAHACTNYKRHTHTHTHIHVT